MQQVPARQPIEKACYWMVTRTREPDLALEGRQDADVVIIGSGFTGLWTSLFLRELQPGLDIVVLEQGMAAHGASGRNAGMLGANIDHSHELAIEHFGRDEAEVLIQVGQKNFEELFQFLAERGIDCDLERNGVLNMALSTRQFEHLREAARSAHALGASQIRVLDAAETRAEINSPLYHGSSFNPDAALVNPVKLVEGLKRESARLGTRFHERTRVTAIEAGRAGVRVRTLGGEIHARKVVLASNAYSHKLLPRLGRYFLPLYDYVLVSEPLSQAQREIIGWRRRQSVGDARTFFNYYRLTADDRVLWGGSDARYHSGNRVDEACDHSEVHYAALRESWGQHFPDLSDVEFPYAWGGPICATTRLTPFFGTLKRGRLVYGLGYTGHGVGSTRLGGRILAHLALGRSDRVLDFKMVRSKPWPYPPEPLRTLAVSAVSEALRRVDRGERPSLLLRALDAMGIGFSS